METTKPILSVSSRSGSASSERVTQTKEADRGMFHPPKPKPGDNGEEEILNPRTVSTVLASLNKMSILRQRTQIMKGNITKQTPLRKFRPLEVSREIERILATALKDVTYDPKRAGTLVKSMSDSIKGKVKTMKFPRYKFIVTVTITSQSDQSMVCGSKCLWNTTSDAYATAQFRNGSLVAVGTVYAMFHE